MSVTSYSMYPSNNIPVYTDQTTMGMWLSRSGGAIPSGATISSVTFTMTANLFTPLGGFYLRNNDLGIRLTGNSLSYSTMIQSDKPSTWALPNAVATQFTGATFTLCLEARDASNDYPSIAPNTYIFSILSAYPVTIAITWTAPTACGAPTSTSISPTIAESDPTLSWSGASDGTLNTISSYEIEYAESSNNSTWGSWTALKTITTTSTSVITGVALPDTRGYYRKYRIRTRGTAGAAYYSGWMESGSVRRNTLPAAPISAGAAPMEYYNETVRVAWTGAAGGTSAIKGYRISSHTSTNNSSWGAWTVLATVDNTATSGFYDPTDNNTPGLYTQFKVETIDVLGAMSAERLTNSILCNVSQAGAPTACSLSATLAEGDVTLAWSGSLAGAGNAIVSYEIQYSDSTNNTTWGAWMASASVLSSSTSGSVSVSPSETRGSYRRYRIRTCGAAGATYYSDWAITSNSVRRNTQPVGPIVFTAVPSLYETPIVTLSWSGSVASTSTIKNHIIQQSTSADQMTWSVYSMVATIVSNAASGTAEVVASNTVGMYTRYRLAVTDVLDTMSSYVISNTVRRTTVPNTPVITAPISNSSTYNVNPRFLLTTGGIPDGRTQSLRVKASSADWVDSAANPDRYSVSGLLVNGVSSIYQMDTLTQGTRVVQIRSFDPASNRESANKNAAFTILASPFSIITAKQRVKATDILTIRTAVNVVRKYYGLPLVVWAEPVVAWLCQIKNWVFHIKEIRTALDEVVALINAHDAVATFDVPSFVWLPIKTGSPQAAVMNQIQALILSL